MQDERIILLIDVDEIPEPRNIIKGVVDDPITLIMLILSMTRWRKGEIEWPSCHELEPIYEEYSEAVIDDHFEDDVKDVDVCLRIQDRASEATHGYLGHIAEAIATSLDGSIIQRRRWSGEFIGSKQIAPDRWVFRFRHE